MLAAETRRFSFGGISFLYLLCQTPANGASASCPAPGAGFSSTTFSSCADHALNVCCPPATARPSAAPLILLHGFAQSSASWDAVARKLAATGRPIYALDLVGHGESERPADACAYALDAQGEALLSFARMVADREGARPAVLGYSMGGRVTLAALRRDPRAFAAVVLEAAGFGPATQAERDAATERDAACAARLRADGLEAFMDFWEQLPLFASQRDLPPDVRERLRAGRMANLRARSSKPASTSCPRVRKRSKRSTSCAPATRRCSTWRASATRSTAPSQLKLPKRVRRSASFPARAITPTWKPPPPLPRK